MSEILEDLRRYRVHAREMDVAHARTLSEASFEGAAVAYVEDLPAGFAVSDISVVVRDLESGHEHCFRVDLATGEAAACG